MNKYFESLKTLATTPEQKMVLENAVGLFLTGSHLYGSNTPESDFDYEGIFIESPEYVLGNKSCDEVKFSTKENENSRNTKDDIDCKFYSLRKFFTLAAENNPNKVEWFFVPEDKFVFKNNYWNFITDNYELFLSQKIQHSFSGYAHSQKNKMVGKKIRYDELKEFLKVLEEGIALGCEKIGQLPITEEYNTKKYNREEDRVHTLVNKRIKGKYQYIKYYMTEEGTDAVMIDSRVYNFGMDVNKIYSHVKREVDKYGQRTENMVEYGFDLKFCSHVFRLYEEGMELLDTGKLEFPSKIKDFMIEIKQGKHSLDFLLEKLKGYDELLIKSAENSKLPYSPNHEEIHNLQIRLMLKFWKERNLI
jgi:predicted nucleotidyltransferase